MNTRQLRTIPNEELRDERRGADRQGCADDKLGKVEGFWRPEFDLGIVRRTDWLSGSSKGSDKNRNQRENSMMIYFCARLFHQLATRIAGIGFGRRIVLSSATIVIGKKPRGFKIAMVRCGQPGRQKHQNQKLFQPFHLLDRYIVGYFVQLISNKRWDYAFDK